jgi:hypothetical protein
VAVGGGGWLHFPGVGQGVAVGPTGTKVAPDGAVPLEDVAASAEVAGPVGVCSDADALGFVLLPPVFDNENDWPPGAKQLR